MLTGIRKMQSSNVRARIRVPGYATVDGPWPMEQCDGPTAVTCVIGWVVTQGVDPDGSWRTDG